MAKDKLSLPPGLDGHLWLHTMPAGGRGAARAHRHTELECNLVLSGRGSYVLDNGRYDLGPGSLAWLFPGQNHILLDCSPGTRIWIGVFRTALVRRCCQTVATRSLRKRDPGGSFCRLLPVSAVRRLDGLMGALETVADDPEEYNAGLAYLLLTSWRAFREAEAIDAVMKLHPAVERAVRLVSAPDAPPTLDGLARRAGLSPSRLSRLFKAQMGEPLTRLRNRRRIEAFLRHRATHPEQTLLASAYEAGFGSYAQFHRVCKEILGAGPAELDTRVASGSP